MHTRLVFGMLWRVMRLRIPFGQSDADARSARALR
jgi:hypothetical protein